MATDALVHLLGRSPAARSAIASILEVLCPDSGIDSLSFTGQVVAEADAGRPDVVGTDASGVRMVLEAKFDAELTETQLGTAYLDRLKPGMPGALIFLVPSDRLGSLWLRIRHGLIASTSLSVTSETDTDSDLHRCSLDDGRVVAAISWSRLLGVVRQALEAVPETDALGELAQIQGLVEWRTRVGWTPLVPGDLPERAGRQLTALRDCVLQAAGEASQKVGRTPTNGTGDWGPGRYIASAAGRPYWAGLSLGAWGRHGLTPVWAIVRPSAGQPLDVIEAVLSNVGPVFQDFGNGVAVAFVVPEGAEQQKVTDSIVQFLVDVGAALDTLDAPAAVGPQMTPAEPA